MTSMDPFSFKRYYCQNTFVSDSFILKFLIVYYPIHELMTLYYRTITEAGPDNVTDVKIVNGINYVLYNLIRIPTLFLIKHRIACCEHKYFKTAQESADSSGLS